MSNKHALIVATSKYNDPKFPTLPSAIADAEALTRVLEDPKIGAFDDVAVLKNRSTLQIKKTVEAFFVRAHPDDFLLLHLSCHGHRTAANRLYFLSRTAESNLLGSTAIESDFINDQIDQSPSRRILLLLDCCFSGAFSRGFRSRAGATESVDVENSFSGRGRLVITASTAVQFAYEREAKNVIGTELIQPSVFTEAIVRGLKTGDADRDKDGLISAQELYEYVFDQMREMAGQQTPTMSGDRAQGTLFVACSPRPSAVVLSELRFRRIMHDEFDFSFPVPVGWEGKRV